MNYQVTTVEYSTPEGKNTATVTKVVGTINLDNITLKEYRGYVLVENNKNEWIFLGNYTENGDAYCVDNNMNIYWYNYDEGEEYNNYMDWDEDGEGHTAEHLRELHYLKAQLN